MKQKVIKFVVRKESDGNILAVYNRECSPTSELSAISYNSNEVAMTMEYYKKETKPVNSLEEEMNILQYLRKIFLPDIKPVVVKRLNWKDVVK